MMIEPYDHDRYFVNLGGGTYLVELGCYDGNGFCGCPHFQMIYQPILERSIETNEKAPVSRCKHIKAVIDSLVCPSL